MICACCIERLRRAFGTRWRAGDLAPAVKCDHFPESQRVPMFLLDTSGHDAGDEHATPFRPRGGRFL